MFELKSLTLAMEKRTKIDSPDLWWGGKQIKTREWNRPPKTIQSFLRMSLLGICSKVTYSTWWKYTAKTQQYPALQTTIMFGDFTLYERNNRFVGRDGGVGRFATGWEVRRSNPVGTSFPHSSRKALEPIQVPVQWVPGLLPRGKAAWEWRWPPNPTTAEVRERVNLHLYSLLDLHGLLQGELHLTTGFI